jgi:hypothetical protein
VKGGDVADQAGAGFTPLHQRAEDQDRDPGRRGDSYGEAANQAEKDLVSKLTRDINGVKSVNNNMTLKA